METDSRAETDSGAETAAGPAPSVPFKKIAVGTAIGLVLLLAAYGAGRVQTASHIDQAVERATKSEEQHEQASVELGQEEAKVSRLEARRRLHRTLLALDERNFGIAQAELSAAAALLESSRPEGGSELEKLTSEIAKSRLVATEDVGTQRERLLDWVRRFDRAVPPATAGAAPQ